MKKKLFIAFMAIITAFCCAFGFTACADEKENGTNSGENQNTEQGGTNNGSGSGNNPEQGSKPEQGGNTGKEPEKVEGSEGLEYTLSDDGTYYYFSGLGTCTDTEITIGNYYNEKPVKQIGKYVFTEYNKDVGNIIEEEHMSLSLFYGSNVESVIISEGITGIGIYVFSNIGYSLDDTDNLKNVSIPDSVTSIGLGAFDNCMGLTNINIPDNVTSIANFTFSCCRGLTSITIPDSVTSIGNYAFDHCIGLTNITIPDSVTSIGEWAFYESGLKSVTIGNSVTSIGKYAFKYCNLLDINFKGTKEKWQDIKKESEWDEGTGNYTIHCTDGELNRLH